ncbi:MAG: tetratricopeptide repeat protein [Candidatus Omnitrophota bacterium]|nr:tetratricopeptide repeat protein [Candidatus Omnitrophota bacterium]
MHGIALSLLAAAASAEEQGFNRERLLQALRTGQFEAVEAHYTALHHAGGFTEAGLRPLTVLYRQVPGEEEWLPLLNAWCERFPMSSYAFTQRGVFYARYAWKARGSGFSATVNPEEWAIFEERMELARRDLERAYELDPGGSYTPAVLIDVAMALGWTHEQMERQFQRAIRADPLDFVAYEKKLAYLTPKWHGSWDQVFDFARKTTAEAPEGSILPMVMLEAYFHYLSDKKFRERELVFLDLPTACQEAEGVSKQLSRDFPASKDVLVMSAGIARYCRKWEVAAAQLEEAIRLSPEDRASLLAELARVYWQQRDLGRAVAAFEQALEADPTDSVVHYELAQVFYEQGKIESAAAHYQSAAELYPAYAEAYYNLGFANYDLGRWAQAKDAFTEFLQQKQARQYPDLMAKAERLIKELERRLSSGR